MPKKNPQEPSTSNISAPELGSTPSPGSSSEKSSTITIQNFVFQERDSPPIEDEYGDYKSDSQLYFSDKLYNVRKWSWWMTVMFVILTLSTITPYSTAQWVLWLAYSNSYSTICRIADLERTSWTFEEIKNISSYSNSSNQCYYYNYDYKLLSQLTFNEALNIINNSPRPAIKNCDRYITNTNNIKYSIIHEFHLECSTTKENTFFFIAQGSVAIGHIIAGFMADKYGRKRTLIAINLVRVLGSILLATSPTFLFLFISSVIVVVVNHCTAYLILILFLEIINYRIRIYAVAAIRVGISIGCFLNVLLLHHIEYWRAFQWAINCTLLVPLLTQWLLPESLHWLLCYKHWQDMKEILQEINYPKFVRINEDILRNSKTVPVISAKRIIQSLFKPLFLRKLIMAIFFFNLINLLYSMEYGRIGSSVNSDKTFFTLVGCALIIDMALVPILLMHFSRPMCICSCLLLLALFFCSYTIYQPYPGVDLVVSCISLVVMEIVFVVNNLIIIEMFPTKVRATVLSMCSSFGALSLLIAKVIKMYSNVEAIDPYLWSVYGALVLIAALICLFINDTGNVPLPDTELQAIVHY